MSPPSLLRLLLPAIVVALATIPVVFFVQWQEHLGHWRERVADWSNAAASAAGLLMVNDTVTAELRHRRDAISPLHYPVLTTAGSENITIEIDGIDDDWPTPSSDDYLPPYVFGRDHLLEVNEAYDPDSLRYSLQVVANQSHLFLLFTVVDDRVIYQQLEGVSAHRNDHIQLAIPQPHDEPERLRRITITAYQPGPARVYELSTNSLRALREIPEVPAYWYATEEGYRVEVAIPRDLLGTHLGLNVTDVDDDHQRTRRYVIGPSSTRHLHEQSALFTPLRATASGLQYSQSPNAALYDTHGYLVACTNRCPSMMRVTEHDHQISLEHPDDGPASLGYLVLRKPDLYTPFDPRLVLLVAALVLLVTIVLLNFGRRLRNALTHLGDDYASTIASDGHITEHQLTSDNHPVREIEALRTALTQVNDRLSEHYDYTQAMPNRLAHELRTPVSVVQSSLDNLQDVPEASQVFLLRAREGIATLIDLIQRMTEASRLEQALEPSEQQAFALEDVIQGLVESYRSIHPDTEIEVIGVDDNDTDTIIFGLPELIAQLLDKVLNNAIDFAVDGTPVRVRLTCEDGNAVVRISNEGPTLPPGDPFSPMKSSRQGEHGASNTGGHLGLGLYIARMIARFHGGNIHAADRLDTAGVTVTLELPIARMSSRI